MMNILQTEPLTKRCLSVLVNNFKKLDQEKFNQMPRNLKLVFLGIISKRGYITDDNISIVSTFNISIILRRIFRIINEFEIR